MERATVALLKYFSLLSPVSALGAPEPEADELDLDDDEEECEVAGAR
jgi:hypothetical protein